MSTCDRFGMKNVFILKNSDKQVYEINKEITEHGFSDFSPKGISSYFTFRYPVKNLTMFLDISRLDAGSTIMDNGSIRTDWCPQISNKPISENDAIDNVKVLLKKAIIRVVGNRQIIGVTLSGGLDSSLLLAMCRELFPDRKIYTYSCGFYGDDEFEYSREVAKLFSDKHREIILGREDFIGPDSIVPALIKQKGAPLHPNETALAYAEIQARKDLCDIVLSGEGADDIFGGYGHNLRMYTTHNGDNDSFFTYIIDHYRYFTQDERQRLLRPEYCEDIENELNVFKERDCPYEKENLMIYFIQRLHTRGLIERGVNALSFSNFPPAFPFIDEELVDYVNMLPFDLKIHCKDKINLKEINKLSYVEISEKYDTTKYLLKKIAESYLPENIVYRQKKGFPVPFNLWFENDVRWNLSMDIFQTTDISFLDGWKKFMVINLDLFIRIFSSYKLE